MAEETRPNVFTDGWQRTMEQGGFGVRGTRVKTMAGATRVGVTVYELDPGSSPRARSSPARRGGPAPTS
jgi:hypothetical protein